LQAVPALSESVVAQIQAAAELIELVDELAEAIAAVVCSAHVLVAERGYDVSHSTPALPLSIFFSVPDADEPHARARLAESIIHEAMHLQLTFIESVVPLVTASPHTAYSPWKQSERPVGGLLHGLYVFAVITEALNVMAVRTPAIAGYATSRSAQIAYEVASMGDGRAGLTDVGVSLWKRLTRQVLRPSETKIASG
jgi:HEXXH motif-containing protein